MLLIVQKTYEELRSKFSNGTNLDIVAIDY